MSDDKFNDYEAQTILLSPEFQKTDLQSRHDLKSQSRKLYTLLTLSSLVGILAGFFAGRFTSGYGLSYQQISTQNGDLLEPLGQIHQVWEHNTTFSGKPTNASEEAWNSIIPVGRGFIYDEELYPETSAISVFHQIHCLHGIYAAYYHALERNDKLQRRSESDSDDEEEETDEATGSHVDSPHVQHCFDYLRRSLMCCADTNLEALDPETRLTNGWGREKVCRDYDAVMDWAEQYRNSSETGIIM